MTRTHGHTTARTTRTKKPSLLSRLMTPRRSPRGHAGTTTTTTTTTRKAPILNSGTRRGHHHATAAPVHHQRRRPSMGDKISGALLKLKGTVSGRPGQKAAGTRRMHGTDGRGTTRRY
ncbi:hypothetical protein EDC01DRAFT_675030 [Geopyxis carbonaria]|nr:hypothetical protein EDC01DRAFT_675030 [Geopyxis carbonaria]